MTTAEFNKIVGITTDEKTKVFEIKVGNTYHKVKATSMNALNAWADANGVKNWRMVGMQSMSEMLKNSELKTVA